LDADKEDDDGSLFADDEQSGEVTVLSSAQLTIFVDQLQSKAPNPTCGPNSANLEM
uniref:Histone deacetylase HDT1 n=1 Tax=Schistocephalus solidus TaxID=70667 RepID=A0A183SCL6_SCHSO